MSGLLITQAEGDALLAMRKIPLNDNHVDLPASGGTVDFIFASENGREEFVLNYTRHSINLMKRNHHFRGRQAIGLARLDLDGPPHRNPDDIEIGPRHLHVYREGYGLKWAVEIPEGVFRNLDDSMMTLEDFMRFCNVIRLPLINRGLFS